MACTLAILLLEVKSPTSLGGAGAVRYKITGADFTTFADVAIYATPGGAQVFEARDIGITYQGDAEYLVSSPQLVAGDYHLTAVQHEGQDNECRASLDFTVTAPTPAQLVDTSLADAPKWEPVGGVLPNPVLLKVEATLLTAGVARAGLHVEVELWRPDAAAAFARFRATVRTATQYVDAAPYLRAELVALQRYAATAGSPFIDEDASLRFYYKYCVVDRTGAEPWQTRAGARYAVLAALPQAADTMAPYVADGTGKVASVFDDYEATQFVGLPLEASVLLPPYVGTPRWAELRYLDAYNNPVEIRSYALAVDLAAGMLRIPLPNDPPLCAVAVEVSVRDDNRAFVGTCGHVIPTPPASTSGTYADPLYGTY
jgi:hypothetical protein